MLDAFIIEEIKRREGELERIRDSERPSVEVPLPPPDPARAPQHSEEEKPPRGVIIIDYSM